MDSATSPDGFAQNDRKGLNPRNLRNLGTYFSSSLCLRALVRPFFSSSLSDFGITVDLLFLFSLISFFFSAPLRLCVSLLVDIVSLLVILREAKRSRRIQKSANNLESATSRRRLFCWNC